MSTQNANGLSASFASNTTAGNAIIVAAAAAGGSAVSSVTDTQGNSYAQAVASDGYGEFCSEHGVQCDLHTRICRTGCEFATGSGFLPGGNRDGGNLGSEDHDPGQ